MKFRAMIFGRDDHLVNPLDSGIFCDAEPGVGTSCFYGGYIDPLKPPVGLCEVCRGRAIIYAEQVRDGVFKENE